MNVQFSSVQDVICALGKSPYAAPLRLSEVSPNVAFETVPMFVRLTMALSRPFKEDRLALPLSTPSLLQAICGMMSLGFVPAGSVSSFSTLQVCREKQATCEGCFCPSVYLLGRFPSLRHVPGSTPTGSKVDVDRRHMPVWAFPFHFSLFVASSLNLWGRWHVWSDCHLLRQSSGGHRWLLPPPLSSWRLRPYRPLSLHGWWSNFAWQWSPTNERTNQHSQYVYCQNWHILLREWVGYLVDWVSVWLHMSERLWLMSKRQ